MGYFSYHTKIKNKIKDDMLIKVVFCEKHNDISPAMLLYFSDNTMYPIREHRFDEYLKIINEN